jgi:hypothetical protein
MWFLLYAQAMQADRATFRNILLLRKVGVPEFTQNEEFNLNTRDILASAVFPEKGQESIRSALALLGLPLESPLSVMAIELLPPTTPDPLGEYLGNQRILRVSPLTPVQAIC